MLQLLQWVSVIFCWVLGRVKNLFLVCVSIKVLIMLVSLVGVFSGNRCLMFGSIISLVWGMCGSSLWSSILGGFIWLCLLEIMIIGMLIFGMLVVMFFWLVVSGQVFLVWRVLVRLLVMIVLRLLLNKLFGVSICCMVVMMFLCELQVCIMFW